MNTPSKQPVPVPAPVSLADARVAALARLQASRERLVQEMKPGSGGGALSWLEHPWRMLRRWWRRSRPAVAAGQWLQTASGDPTVLRQAGEAAVERADQWVRRHPMAGIALAAGMGALMVYKRGALWSIVLGVGRGLMRQGQMWAVQQVSDPALYATLVAAFMTKSAAPEEKDE